MDDKSRYFVLKVTPNGFPTDEFKGPYPFDEALKIAEATRPAVVAENVVMFHG